MLREYQQRSINDLYAWFSAGNNGNPCLVLPTGSGKSHIVAALCKDAIQRWPQTRILMLTHVKELIQQNAEKMLLHWPGAPLGIYSAGLGSRDIGKQITFAGIQSVRKKAAWLGYIDLVIIDEAHTVNHAAEGGYRALLADLAKTNPDLRIIGLTATPYRLGHGMIHHGSALFDDIIEPVSIEYLVMHGYLARLASKVTESKLDTTGVKKRGGEYIESELQKAVDTDQQNEAIVDEIIARAEGRKAWLIFCAGVDHAQHVKDALIKRGIVADCITGSTPKRERERILSEYKAGRIQAITNANVLTTGFDYPDIDLIAMLRPTLSPGLYIQMAGRGMRLKSHTDHCLVLDFAGNVQTHGPITAVQPPSPKGKGAGEAPAKVCEHCGEICALNARKCPACGELFPEPEPKDKGLRLHNDCIMGTAPIERDIFAWRWSKHISATSGKEMLKVRYYSVGISGPPVTEYIPILHDGYAGQKAMQTIAHIAEQTGNRMPSDESLVDLAATLESWQPPRRISYKMQGKYPRIIKRSWDHETAKATGND